MGEEFEQGTMKMAFISSMMPEVSGGRFDGQGDSTSGGWDHREASSFTGMFGLAGCKLSPDLGCQLEILPMASSCGLPQSMAVGFQKQVFPESQLEALLPFITQPQ